MLNRPSRTRRVSSTFEHDNTQGGDLTVDARLRRDGKQLSFERVDVVVQGAIVLAFGFDRLDGVHHRRVVAPAEISADLLQAVSCVLASQPHANLARQRNGFMSALGQELAWLHAVVTRHRVDDFLDCREMGVV